MIYKFTTDDEMEATRVLKATKMALVIFEMLYNTRKDVEWEIESKKITCPYEGAELVFTKFRYLLADHDINIDRILE